ncbi:MAG TPA: GAF domain-containing sensor histidine kinase, partial [Polyangiaceae bacterium]|nr:GAF domain-containing sensor histidine kinase [Polyangiaceae bacterium]
MRAGWDRHTMSAIGPHVAKVLALVGFAVACVLAPHATRGTLGAASLLFACVVVVEAIAIARLRAAVVRARLQAEELVRHAAEVQLAAQRDLDARRRGERLTRFLNEAADVLASSLDCDATISTVARLAVPDVADWVAIELESPGGLRLAALAHSDPEKVLRASVGRERSLEPDEQVGQVAACFRPLDLVSVSSVPLRVQGMPVGAISLGSAESRRHFGPEDVAFAQALAHRVSVALENARTFRESEQTNRVKDEFLATISHELRTPLNAILGWTTMLRRKPDVDAKKALDTIERNARAQMRLIEDVLDVSRAVTGKLAIEPAEMDLVDVVRAALAVVTPMAEARAISLETAFEAVP